MKCLTISEEAYERLKAYKREDESVSDTILRITGSNHDVMAGFGTMKDIDGFTEAVESARTTLDEGLRERTGP